MKATDFSLPDQDGKIHKLSDYKGHYVVLYFYPKDDTPGCTKEACGFRDNLEKLKKLGVIVLGVSKDTVDSHKKFHNKFNLTFPLLSDMERNVIDAYKAWGEKQIMGRKYFGILRTTYLIGKDGEILKVYEKVNPEEHVSQILEDINKLAK